MVIKEPILSQPQVMIVIKAALTAAAPDGLEQDEVARVIKWVETAKMDGAMADLVLLGDMVMQHVNGDWQCRATTSEEKRYILHEHPDS